MRTLFLTMVLCCFEIVSHAQLDTNRVRELQKFEFEGVYRSTISVNVGGVTGIVGVSYDVLLSRHWQFECGLGFPAIGFGFSYYPFSIKREEKKFKVAYRSLLIAFPINTLLVYHSIGFGLTFFTRNKWNVGFDVGGAYVHSGTSFDYQPPSNLPFHISGNLKAGYRFSFRVMKRRKELDREQDEKDRRIGS